MYIKGKQQQQNTFNYIIILKIRQNKKKWNKISTKFPVMFLFIFSKS